MSLQLCTGCGHALQLEHPELPGFAPKSALEKEMPLCRRCFRIRHYGEFTHVAVSDDTYAKQVSRIKDEPGLVLYVLDVFDLEGSLVHKLSRFVANSRVVLIVNKVDLLPPEVNYDSLRTWVRGVVEKTGVRAPDVHFVSAESATGVAELNAWLDDIDAPLVYVVGMANVGKSTLLNQLLRRAGQEAVFTASRMPGTTLGLARLEIETSAGHKRTFVDTPGLIHGTRVTDMLCADCLKTTVPASRLRPRVFQLNAAQTLWLGGFVRFDFTAGTHQAVVCYVSNALTIHRTKLERAEYIGLAHADDILAVPCATCRVKYEPRVAYSVATRLANSQKSTATSLIYSKKGADIVIPGLGWITLFGSDFHGTLWAPSGIKPVVRARLVGDISRQNA